MTKYRKIVRHTAVGPTKETIRSKRWDANDDSRQGRTLEPSLEEPHLTNKLLLAWQSRSPDQGIRRAL